ncbi:aconitate hydratase [Gracilibacillus boraciitolerans JCM 21714]|uniref:aconitate hydratase n=1 Tax=Gracilibacillus boraciitolerans JCM 21714 TaxID=1298598 RepID=W4VPK7_9BACI|nr:aconitate hydratase [Gracilibacillus boraciitolerans JCM 21714]
MHQAGCNGCIGMGQAPATGRNSLRTTPPRNFPGRSGTKEDSVFLCSPETAAASALTGKITDPRTLNIKYPKIQEPKKFETEHMFEAPSPPKEDSITLEKGPNITSIPDFKPIEDNFNLPVLLKMSDNISTDEILAGGSRVLPFRSNIQRISTFAFEMVDDNYYEKAMKKRDSGGHMLLGGSNYGQGSSREHAALAPRYLGLKVVLVKDFARIHLQNLINFGILPLTFEDKNDFHKISQDNILEFRNIHQSIQNSNTFDVKVKGTDHTITVRHDLTPRHIDIILQGGIINWIKQKQS